MFVVHARYRGRDKRRREIVESSAEALSTLPGVRGFSASGVEDIQSQVEDAGAVTSVVMALLSDGNWAIAIACGQHAKDRAARACGRRPMSVRVVGDEDVEAVFLLLAQVLGKRTPEGREATSLVRRGMTQNEAAGQLGISKQAMSQRLQAAGWAAENAGWQLAVNLLELFRARCV
ncbi:MarR family transcriptional regulator [Corynebacterium tapiri]|uniref:MarR family transcriptional regulator n=1 Tax=Corynebacterium tapiri TaxID=1448266 RepID=A0A5C4U3W0_9CORY|nr:MarR family transcriptional regulator [Corynebacterium tapiri]TNL97596.1 MarR family transcriptional regulator [Corynebacterium tapiri]